MDETEVGRMAFRGVGFVKIVSSPGLDAHKALAMAEQIIAMMRTELSSAPTAAPEMFAENAKNAR